MPNPVFPKFYTHTREPPVDWVVRLDGPVNRTWVTRHGTSAVLLEELGIVVDYKRVREQIRGGYWNEITEEQARTLLNGQDPRT